jgi:hypothetical protein
VISKAQPKEPSRRIFRLPISSLRFRAERRLYHHMFKHARATCRSLLAVWAQTLAHHYMLAMEFDSFFARSGGIYYLLLRQIGWQLLSPPSPDRVASIISSFARSGGIYYLLLRQIGWHLLSPPSPDRVASIISSFARSGGIYYLLLRQIGWHLLSPPSPDRVASIISSFARSGGIYYLLLCQIGWHLLPFG